LPVDTVGDRLAGQLGETIAALHQLPPPALVRHRVIALSR
jgi:hypothetical protein